VSKLNQAGRLMAAELHLSDVMYCRWQSPDGKHTILIQRPVLEELRNRVIEAFLSLPSRGAEIGGILFGHADGEHVRIESIEEVPCEHRFGPSYVLSSTDRDTLKTTLASKASTREVVGAYRSYTRRPAALDDADQQLFRTFFPDARYVFLLFEPLSALESQVSFLSFVEGELPSVSTYPPMGLSDFLAQAPEPQETLPAAVPSPVTPDPARPLSINLPPAHRRREREELEPPPPSSAPQRRRVVLPLIACIVLSIGAAGIYELWTMASAPRWSDLRLDARRNSGGDLELTWDAKTPAALLASRGVLMVTDGSEKRNLELSSKQVKTGTFTYRQLHPDVLFRLQLYGDGLRPSGDSLHVLTAVPIPASQVALAGPKPVAPPPQVAVAPAPNPPSPRPVTPPKRNQPDRASSERTEPPDRAGAAKAPEPLHQVQPVVPDGIRSRIESRMVVPIQVKVNKDGRVVQAISPGDGTGLYRFLADESVKAARQWRFTPAKSARGKPVEGQKTIEFVFSPSSTP
jgi:hypothetical protein